MEEIDADSDLGLLALVRANDINSSVALDPSWVLFSFKDRNVFPLSVVVDPGGCQFCMLRLTYVIGTNDVTMGWGWRLFEWRWNGIVVMVRIFTMF